MPADLTWSAVLTTADYPDPESAARILLRLARSPFGVNVLVGGTVAGDGITDDGPAIQAILDANPSRKVYLPRTATTDEGVSYYSSVPLVLRTRGQGIVGESGGLHDGTIVRFAKGVTGIDIRLQAGRAEVRDIVLL